MNQKERDAIFQGELRVVHHVKILELVNQAQGLLDLYLGSQCEEFHPQKFLRRLAQARRQLASSRFHAQVIALLRETSLLADDLCLDQLRLRAIPPGLEQNPLAAPVFYAHRDSWYSNPGCQINAWIPMHPVDVSNSFEFYLEFFQEPVANDSFRFNSQYFQKRGGFGDLKNRPSQVYPRALTEDLGTGICLELAPPAMLLFSPVHLHRTLNNRSNKTRFSLDFRFYFQSDLEAGRGAQQVDNFSQVALTYPGYRFER